MPGYRHFNFGKRIPEEFNFEPMVDEHYKLDNEKYMNFKPLISAAVSAVLASVLAYVGNLTTLTYLDLKQVGLVALIALLSSLVKYLGTTTNGNFAGLVSLK